MIYHSGIFYPSDRAELDEITGRKEAEPASSPKAIILPHMDLRRAASLYRKAFSSIQDGKRIAAILPLHRPPLECDKPSFLFSSRERTEDFINGSIVIENAGLPYADAYEKEEAALELIYPFISSYCPSSHLVPVFSAALSSQEVKKLTETVHSLDDGNTVFIVSSNMTGLTGDPVAERDRMIERLISGESLLDSFRKGRISACGTPIIEAVSRALPGSWELIGKADDDRKAGHAALIRW